MILFCLDVSGKVFAEDIRIDGAYFQGISIDIHFEQMIFAALGFHGSFLTADQLDLDVIGTRQLDGPEDQRAVQIRIVE